MDDTKCDALEKLSHLCKKMHGGLFIRHWREEKRSQPLDPKAKYSLPLKLYFRFFLKRKC